MRDTGVCGTFSINLNANIPPLLQGGTWFNDGIPVDAPTVVDWTGTFIYQKTSGTCTVIDTMIIFSDVPDYQPLITILPNTINGPSNINVIITVVENEGKLPCRPIRINIPVFG